jgi:hypothetical protein
MAKRPCSPNIGRSVLVTSILKDEDAVGREFRRYTNLGRRISGKGRRYPVRSFTGRLSLADDEISDVNVINFAS